MFKKLKSLFSSSPPEWPPSTLPTADEINSFRLSVNRSAIQPFAVSTVPHMASLLCYDVGDTITGMQYVSCWGSEPLLKDCVALVVDRWGEPLPSPGDLRHAAEDNWFPWLLVKYIFPDATERQRTLVLEPLGIVGPRLDVLLMDAVRTNHPDCIEVLIRHGANVNYKASHNEDMTPLCKAAALGLGDTCTLLLDRGARVNDADVHGCSALHWAARKGHTDIVAMLEQRGGDGAAKTTQTYGFKTPHELLEEFRKRRDGV